MSFLRDIYGRTPPALRGIGFMLASTVLFALMQVCVRSVSDEIHPFETAFFRNFFGVLFMLPLLLRAGPRVLRTQKIHMHVLRGSLQTCSLLLMFYALTIGKLSDNVALSFTAPLYTAILAVLFLGEKAEWRRWAALAAGFAGVLIIMRPGSGAIGLSGVLVLVSSVLWGSAMMSIKFMARTDSALTMNIYMGLTMGPLSLIPALFVWTWPSPEAWAWLAGVGFTGVLAHLLLAQSFREADATAVLPYDFVRLLWAALFGFAFFGEEPGVWTLVGGAVIFGSATFIAMREARVRRQAS